MGDTTNDFMALSLPIAAKVVPTTFNVAHTP